MNRRRHSAEPSLQSPACREGRYWYFGTREGGQRSRYRYCAIKVDAITDELVSHAAHFMSRSKKKIVDAALREYIDAHREEINAGIKAALGQLNGTAAAAASLLTGLGAEELDDLVASRSSRAPGVLLEEISQGPAEAGSLNRPATRR
ncbi:hypothetical protein [Nocardioides sp. LS1]|uniref:hypothetical protein n=1 Tax=Nocardioides sp. LS1 TaxID=1027620 RepID=UPI000FFA89FC|nr:hypothetical protein [Nocardioides sp. LS1]GCD91089.1 hypothetical protein NLS1_30950 [Nocardioides sp. LS1]